IEIGPRDIETRKICVQRRDQAATEKTFPLKEDFIREAGEMLDEIHQNLLARARAFRDANIAACDNLADFDAHWETDNPGWLFTPWAGSAEQEQELSKKHRITIRCIPVPGAALPAHLAATGEAACFLTGTPTTTRVIWGRSY
nr:proline--tRNA ligase [Akkermansiaceae bacterium]